MLIVWKCAECPFRIQLDDPELTEATGLRCPACARPMIVVDSVKAGLFCSRCGSKDVNQRNHNAATCRKCGASWGLVG